MDSGQAVGAWNRQDLWHARRFTMRLDPIECHLSGRALLAACYLVHFVDDLEILLEGAWLEARPIAASVALWEICMAFEGAGLDERILSILFKGSVKNYLPKDLC